MGASDEVLLTQLRQGNRAAYTELWKRHVSAALRVGRRLSPHHAEDLVSDAFLALYQQVSANKGGPQSAFRAYLFTVMRNTAMRWNREGRVEVNVDELNFFDQFADLQESSTLDLLERDSTSAELLAAMSALPERWQRILWLSEVEDASRTEIAQDLGIKPNAVSALQRRARSGLRMNWLTRQIPVELQDDSSHVARLLPRLIVDGRADGIARQVNSHLAECLPCATLNTELRAEHGRMRKVTLGLAGFAALGGTIPAMAPLSIVGTTAAIGALGLFGIGAASVGILIAGATLSAGGSFPWGVDKAQPGPTRDASVHTAAPSAPAPDSEKHGAATTEQQPLPPASVLPALGRGNSDATIPIVAFGDNNYVPPSGPQVQTPGSLPGPSTQPASAYQAGLTTPRSMSGNLAPLIGGKTRPGSTVAIELAQRAEPGNVGPAPTQYIAPVAVDGSWTFDFRSLVPDRVGTYDYSVWAFTGSEASAPEKGQFVVSPPVVVGFDGLKPFEMVPLAEASTTGFVFTVAGPVQGNICLDSVYAGQTAKIPLDATGSAAQRIRLLTGGTYYLTFRACEGEYRGPAVDIFIDVDDPDNPIFGPMGPDPADTQIAISGV